MGLQSRAKEAQMGLYIGIDWSENKHDIVFMNEPGAAIARVTIPHTAKGFLHLVTECDKLGIEHATCVVGLETAHNILIDFLWTQQYKHVYVIPPSVVKGNRQRHRSSGARTDQSDAYLLADILRTDRGRLYPWHPDSLLTRQIRAKVSYIAYLTRNIVRTSNRLRSLLLRYYPAALSVFSSLQTQIRLQFICAYPTPQATAELTFAEFRTFAAQQGYKQPTKLAAHYAALQGPHPEPSLETESIYQQEGLQLARSLLQQIRAKNAAQRELGHLFARHPDAFIFDSLPGAGDLLAPGLLAKFGDDRRRFPAAGNVQALAGTCPVTESSGKRKVIRFRRACDREFRDLAQKWARASLSQSVWANAYWREVRPRCASNSHAYRCLANRWLAVAWKIWQTKQPYDEAYHLQQRAKHSEPRR
jgi:transposase